MKDKSTHIWKCDTCTAEAEGTEYRKPTGWRVFKLDEEIVYPNHAWKWDEITTFCICTKCHGDIYYNMHPIRKALTIAGVFKKKWA